MNCSSQMIGRFSGLLFLFFFLSPIFSQSDSIDFTLQFYFENGIGERDTINIFASPFANNTYNPELGEVNKMGLAFEGTFDVKVGRGGLVSPFPETFLGENIALLSWTLAISSAVDFKETLMRSTLKVSNIFKYASCTIRVSAHNIGFFQDFFPSGMDQGSTIVVRCYLLPWKPYDL